MQQKLFIRPNATQLDCERMITQLTDGAQYSLELPDHVDGYGVLGMESSIISLIVAWARHSKCPELHLPITKLQKVRYLGALCQTSYGLTALALSKVLKTSEGTLVPSREIKDLVTKRLAEFDTRNLKIFAKEEGLSFLSVFGHFRERAKWLYAGAAEPDALAIHTPHQISDWL